jgi:hypothetical protein
MSRMQLSTRRRALIVWVGAIALVALVGLWLRPGPTAARAGSPPPDQPQFTGMAVRESFPVPALRGRPAAQAPAVTSDWMITFEEDWEDGFDEGVWVSIDRNGAAGGEYKWADRAVDSPLNEGARSAWAVGGGQNGQAKDPADGGYPGGVDSWLIYGPFSLAAAGDAELSFNYAFEADDNDTFSVLVLHRRRELERPADRHRRRRDVGGAQLRAGRPMPASRRSIWPSASPATPAATPTRAARGSMTSFCAATLAAGSTCLTSSSSRRRRPRPRLHPHPRPHPRPPRRPAASRTTSVATSTVGKRAARTTAHPSP